MLWLHGIGHFHPEEEITNRFLEELDIGTSESWIVERVGIRSRRTVLPLDYIRRTRNADPRAACEAARYTNAETGSRAARMALDRAGIATEDVGMIITATCTPDTTAPAEACNIANALGIRAPAFDLSSACSSFSTQLYMLSLMRPEALPPFVLIVIPENTTRVVDFSDRRAAVLWGDGSAAAVVSAHHPGPASLHGNTLESDPSGAGKVVIPRQGHFRQNGSAVQKFAITQTTRRLRDLRAAHPDVAREKFHFIGHQANGLMLDSVCRACDIAPEQHHSNIALFGNTGAAGTPSVLSTEWESFRAGDHVAIIGVGAGLTWSSAILRFECDAAAFRGAPPRDGRPAPDLSVDGLPHVEGTAIEIPDS